MARARARASLSVTYAFLTIAAFVAAAPIAGVVLISLNPPNAPVGGFTLSHLGLTNLRQVWTQGDFAGTLTWSLIIAVTTVAITLAVSLPAGYAFAVIRFPGRKPAFYLVVFGLLLPPPAILIPLFYEFRFISLSGTTWSVILPTSAFSVAFGIFWMRAVFLGVPRELLEAALVDGAGMTTRLTRIALPLARSGALVLVLLTFISSWNSFMLPLVMLAGSNVQTAPLSLAAFQGGHVDNIPGLAAAAVFVLAPAVLVYVFTQRHFIRGLTEGGLKM